MVIDLIIIGVMLLFTFIGYKKGLIKVAVKILSFFIAIIMSITLCTPLTNFIVNNTRIDENIELTMQSKIIKEGRQQEQDSEKTMSAKGALALLNINKENTLKNITHEFAIKTIKIASVLIIFVATKIVLLILVLFTDAISKLPIINQFNKLGGTVYGFFKGIFIIYFAFAIIFVLSATIDTKVINKINDSTLGNTMYNNNLLLKILF